MKRSMKIFPTQGNVYAEFHPTIKKIKNIRMKYYMIALVGIFFFISCRQEGPMGPPGDPGPDGTNGVGSGGNINSYSSPAGATIEWGAMDGWDNSVLYALAINGNERIKLPDSVVAMIENGGVIQVYMHTSDGFVRQLPYSGDRNMGTYSYLLQKWEDVFNIGIYARVPDDEVTGEDRDAIPVKEINVVVIPASEHIVMELE